MQGISTALRLVDQMTAPIMSITNSINTMTNRFNEVQNSVDIDTSSLTEMQNQVNAANAYAEQLQEQFLLVQDTLEQTTTEQNGFNNSLNNGVGAADMLGKKIGGMAAAYATVQSVQKVLDLSDIFTSTAARLDLMNDGLQTTRDLQNMIFLAAERSRGEYQATADTISKLGILAKGAFSSNTEMISFAEQMNKQFIIGGAGVQEQTSAMYQLTQAMAAGKLQGEEFVSIMKNAPMLAQAIASYMGKTTGELREMSSEGLITADVIKNALFSVADETNARFESMPMTFGQVMTSMKNKALMEFEPILTRLSEIANSPAFQTFVDNAVSTFVVLAAIVLGIFDTIGAVGQFIADNWSIIAPIVWAVVAAMTAYAAYLGIVNGIELISKGIKLASAVASYAKAAATGVEVGATAAATAAQWGLNAALLACPITWILLIIIAVIAAIYLVIGVINKLAGTSVSATGVIFGAFTTLGAFLWNLFLGLLELVLGIVNAMINPFIKLANFIGNVFTNPISSIIYLFQGMADGVLAILETIAGALDFVFGSNMAGAVAGWRSGLKEMADAAVAEYAPNENYQNVMDELDLSVEGMGLQRWSYGDAWDTGYSAGEAVDEAIGNFDPASLFNTNIPGAHNYAGGGFSGSDPSGIESSVSNIDANTKGTLDYSEEELKLWRDISERDAIDQYTLVSVDMGGFTTHNTVNSEMDLDGIVNYIADTTEETLLNIAEGVHE